MTIKCKILVVDDNRDAADILSELIGSLGYEVVTAYDGLQALQLVTEKIPDIIFLDIGMPKMNGFELASEIRRNPMTRHAYLVAISGWNDAATLKASKASGINEHFSKPIDFCTIKSALQHCPSR